MSSPVGYTYIIDKNNPISHLRSQEQMVRARTEICFMKFART